MALRQAPHGPDHVNRHPKAQSNLEKADAARNRGYGGAYDKEGTGPGGRSFLGFGSPYTPDFASDMSPSTQAQAAEGYYSDLLSGRDRVGEAAMRRGIETGRMHSAGMLGSVRGLTPGQAAAGAQQQLLQESSAAQGKYQDVLEKARSGAAAGMSQIGLTREGRELEAALQREKIRQQYQASMDELKGGILKSVGEGAVKMGTGGAL